MPASLLLCLLLSQAPESNGAVVLVTRRTGATVAAGAELSKELRKALTEAGIGSPLTAEQLSRKLLTLGVKDAKACEGKKECVLELGRQLKVPVVISVSVGQIARDLSIHVEALRVEGGARLAEQTLVAKVNELQAAVALLAPFVATLREALGPPAATPPAEPAKAAPVAELLPPPTPPPSVPPEAVVATAQPRSRVPAIAVGGAALVSGGVAAYFAVAGLGDKSRLDQLSRSGTEANIPRSEAAALASSANTRLTIALACGIGTIALGTLSAILFGTSGAPTEAQP